MRRLGPARQGSSMRQPRSLTDHPVAHYLQTTMGMTDSALLSRDELIAQLQGTEVSATERISGGGNDFSGQQSGSQAGSPDAAELRRAFLFEELHAALAEERWTEPASTR